MPKFNVGGRRKRLVIFLKSRQGLNFAETWLARYRRRITPAKAEITPEAALNKPAIKLADQVAEGKALFEDRACTACHKLGDKDGGIAPDLSFEGRMRDEEWLRDHFRAPRSRIPDSNHAGVPFQRRRFRRDMTAYLESRQEPP